MRFTRCGAGHGPKRSTCWLGSLLYLFGTIGVTIAANVPRNDALATTDAASADAARMWTGYLRTWTAWNHVRVAAGLAAAAFLIMALLASSRGTA
ncbi:MAG: anthrone oxygenase family protein [Candidatus Binatia bacterium]